MKIPRIDFLIFGYRIIKLNQKDLRAALNILLNNGICIKTEGCSFAVSERKFKRIKALFFGKVPFSFSESLGFFGILKRYKSRVGIFAALALSFFVCFFSSGRVWDIRIQGAEYEASETVLDELSEYGLSIGTPFRNIDKGKIETEMLLKSDTVSWININQRGTVLYVKVIEKHKAFEEEMIEGYRNIVASRDCIIEEIIVKKGYPAVKVGETVKKGQILISGVIPSELGGGFCYAEGEVIGRYSDEICVSVANTEYLTREYKREKHKANINFFNFSLKFFENYRKTEEKYDIIKENRRFLSFLGNKLPISLVKEYRVFYGEYPITYTKDEMIRLGAQRMKEAVNTELLDKTLVKIKTRAEFNEASYVLVTDYVALADVGRGADFYFNESKIGD